MQAKVGDTVSIHLRGTLTDGTVFTATEGKDPHRFTIGRSEVVPGLEEAVIGMEEGETVTVSIPPAKGFGEREATYVTDIARADMPGQIDPTVGMRIRLPTPKGNTVELTVIGVSDDTITVDANHPLAGETLTFQITLVEVL